MASLSLRKLLFVLLISTVLGFNSVNGKPRQRGGSKTPDKAIKAPKMKNPFKGKQVVQDIIDDAELKYEEV